MAEKVGDAIGTEVGRAARLPAGADRHVREDDPPADLRTRQVAQERLAAAHLVRKVRERLQRLRPFRHRAASATAAERPTRVGVHLERFG